MCETRRVFLSSGEVPDANVLGNFNIHILSILRLRSELVNDRNDKTGTKFYPCEVL